MQLINCWRGHVEETKMPGTQVRFRIGIRLGWPIQNAGIMVRYTSEEGFVRIADALGALTIALSSLGLADVAARFVLERTN